MAQEETPPEDLADRGTIMDDDAQGAAVPIPDSIGSYDIKGVIGAGAMGVVYLARQSSPERDVAIKVMKSGVVSRKAMRRFEFEAQTLGRLQHPAIAQVYEANTWDDGDGARPFFAMEYVTSAKELGDFVQDNQLDTRDRLELFCAACEGVEYGHRRGVIHRDLKPGNILVDADGRPKIIDFGVARSTDSDMAVTTLQTDMGALIGTLQYMSPEQCAADPHDIDVRSDVYALGVVLYELLTEGTPYDVSNQAIHEAVRIVREDPPTKPSTVNRVVTGDIETICLKALEKDRDRRYQSAQALEQDIERYLDGEPIAARRPTLTYQLKLMYRRHRAASVLSMALLGLLIASVVALSLLASSQSVALHEAQRQATRSQAMIDGITSLITPPFDTDASWDTSTPWKAVLDHARQQVEWETLGELANEMHALHVGYFRLVLAEGYINCGAYAEALALTQGTTRELLRWFPHNHLNLLDARVMEAKALMAADRMQEAVDLGAGVLQAKVDQLGAESPDTLGTVWEIAMLFAEAGRIEDAQRVCEAALGNGEILKGKYVKQAVDLLFVLNLLPLEQRPALVQQTHVLCVKLGDAESLDLLLMLIDDEIGLTPRGQAALESLNMAQGAIKSLEPNSELARSWRILRGHALEGLGRLEEADAVFKSLADGDRTRTDLEAWDRDVVQSALQRIHDRMGLSNQ